jgi:hypothetical protein
MSPPHHHRSTHTNTQTLTRISHYFCIYFWFIYYNYYCRVSYIILYYDGVLSIAVPVRRCAQFNTAAVIFSSLDHRYCHYCYADQIYCRGRESPLILYIFVVDANLHLFYIFLILCRCKSPPFNVLSER